MGKDKLKRWAEMETFERVFERDVNFEAPDDALKGHWHEKVFHNKNKIVLELGCGRGEYTVGLAQHYPEKNFIGLDIKGARMWRGAKTANEENILNIAFLRMRIELIEKFFSENEISEIWVTFPDPQPRESKENRRLTSAHFLEKYKRMMGPNGLLHLKTDSRTFYDFTLDVLKTEKGKLLSSTQDLYNATDIPIDLTIQTTYEKIFRDKGKSICYLCFEFGG